MSQENVDKAREFIEAYNVRDFDRATAHFDRDIEWILPEDQPFNSCQGIPCVIRFFKSLDDAFEDLQLKPQEFVDGGEMVATRLRHFGRGKGSGVEVDTELVHQVATFRDGLIVRMEYVASWPEAQERLTRGTRERSEAKA
jgi:ketosteroid isomerase-like protein